MQISIPYGRDTEVSFSIPDQNFTGLLEPPQITAAADPDQAIAAAIDQPIGCAPLHKIVSRESRVNIICDDISRPTPVQRILPILIQKLAEIGVREEQIKIVMALGSHRYMTAAEMETRVGSAIYHRFPVVNSEFRKQEDLVNLGNAPDGVAIYASKTAMDSDIRIGIGNIVPHPVAGWSGGAKILFPGVTGEQTVARFHMQGGLADENLFGREECPIRLNMEKWVDTVGLHFIINTVLTPEGQIYKVVAGHYVNAQRQGVVYAKRALGCAIPERADICVVSSYPADADFWQSGKGMCAAEHAVKSGTGTIILVAPNDEGMGPHDEYPRYFGMDDAPDVLQQLFLGEPFSGDPVALSVGTAMSKMRRRVKLVMVTDGLSREDTEACKVRYYPLSQIQLAIDDAMAGYQKPTVSVIRHGGELYVYQA
ncbi:MAG: nickel-dependent lactate racemase [Ruminococcaceae bacterium]|nr:nickel-dependent lactate racemase [Oscillospiraceae bacterium]